MSWRKQAFSRNVFVSDVSHELRTPVTTMRMASDLLEMKKDGFDPSTKRTVELLAGQISRFQDMLADLLEISRYDAGYAALDLVETDLCEPIETAVDQVDGIAQAKRVPIHTYLPNVQVLTRIDSRRVIRIVRNLLANAVDFAEDRPIEVRVAANRKAVAISVGDYGVGIDEDKVAHVFDRFWRGDLSRSRVTGGTGLGLSIAMTDALLHHGSIRVRSAVGEGTWFLVLLPRDPDQGEVADAELPVNFASETPDDLRVTGGFGVATSQVTHDYHEVRRDTMMGRLTDETSDQNDRRRRRGHSLLHHDDGMLKSVRFADQRLGADSGTGGTADPACLHQSSGACGRCTAGNHCQRVL